MTPSSRPRFAVTIVAARRPDLLARTLESFDRHLLAGVPLGEVRVNLDPVFGDDADHAATRALILDRFPDAVLNEPVTPGFGTAVKWLWSGVTSDLPVLHLEDDWQCLHDVDPAVVAAHLQGRTASLCMLNPTHGSKGQREFSTRIWRRKVFGHTVHRSRIPLFNTGPGFFRADFLRRCGALMNPALDPEKQMRPPHNMRLFRYLRRWDCRFLKGPEGRELLAELGRDWRDARGIVKSVEGARSAWTGAPES